ncbi:dynactin subunit 4-like [Teleopsis dalmanni]|uniref:dynactin subunit 4-like n=1 Tax=Teleopsis dalmanni TaxID=139649 RepID=UPI0018CDF375|nr:dynactin subunit 4-like [Teleopsis dalmanni]XP_037939431.1 dynactin subunit 4-like [Teleopsis dalmanni]
MANFMQESVVNYVCSCGILNPIYKLFFCRHCLKLRCGFCVCHEVDSHFCSNCLENIPSSEARHKKNCCTNCFDCPSCQHTLSARATTVVKKLDDASKEGESDPTKVVTKKMYYLSCLACRWTSRDAGIPDQSVATGAWPDSECSYRTRFNSLLEYYQAVVLQDKQEKQEYMRRKTPKAHKFPSLTDRTGLTVSMIRRQIGWSDKTTQKAKPVNIAPSVASEDVGELPASIFTQKLNLKNITTIEQRHFQPADQPISVNKLYPQRRCLWIKRSLRCRQCEHNVIKPEYHPTSIKYRIQLFANYHVPDVLLVRCEQPLLQGKSNSVILKLTNPTMHDMKIAIMDLPTVEEEMKLIEALKNACNVKDTSLINTSDPNKSITTLSRQTSLNEEPRMVRFQSNSKLEMLDSSFVINLRDDSKEFDEVIPGQKEEPKFITWRKANKVSIRLNFTPDETLKQGDDVILGFSMEYTYVNTVTNTAEKKEPTSHALNSRVYIKVGEIAAQ